MRGASIITLAFVGATSCSRHVDPIPPDAIHVEGVTARFEVPSQVKRGKALKVTAIYRNDSDKTVVFHCTAAAIYDSEIWHGKLNKTNCVMAVEIPHLEVTLKPGEEYRAPDELPIEGQCFDPGHYEIRFYYGLSLLQDPQLQAQYARMYPVRGGAIRWGEP